MTGCQREVICSFCLSTVRKIFFVDCDLATQIRLVWIILDMVKQINDFLELILKLFAVIPPL